MKAAIINPTSANPELLGRYRSTMEPFPPLGVASISAVLREAGHDVIAIDQYAEDIYPDVVIKRLIDFAPQIIGISCLTPAMPAVELLCSRIRDRLPECVIVLGNVHASVFAERLLRKNTCDYVVHGEGENAIVRLAEALEHKGDTTGIPGISFMQGEEFISTGPPRQIEDLDSLPLPAWDLLPIEKYQAHPMLGVSGVILPVQAIRGCPYNCKFCSQNAMYKKVRVRDVIKVVDEIEYLVDRYRLKLIGLADSIFPLTKEMGFEFSDEIRRRGLHKRIKWFTESRVDLVDYELLKSMKDAGLHMILYGIESGSSGVLDENRKGISPDIAREAVAMTRRAGLLCVGLYVIGLPGDTPASCRQTIDFAIELDTDFAKFNIAVPYPGSRFFDEWYNGRRDELDYHKFSSWYIPKPGEKLLYVPEGMTQEQVLKYQHIAMARFWMRPSKVLGHLVRGSISPSTMWRGFRAMALNLAGTVRGG